LGKQIHFDFHWKKAEKNVYYITKGKIVKKTFLRLLLIASLILNFPGAKFFPMAGNGTPSKATPAETGNEGMGGVIFPENMPIQPDIDFEIWGMPEPEEYSLPHILTFSSYVIEQGDMIGYISIRSGLNEDTLISVNDIKNTRLLQIGQVIRIPNQDGIYYTAKAGDTLESIADQYATTASNISFVNELFSDTIRPNSVLFIPGAKMDWVNRQEINGDLFIWPITGRITSLYGYRTDPFGDTRQFHTGLDISAVEGTPIKAAMAGRVSQVGYHDSYGNHVVITHHSGYRTLYGHMSVIRVKAGAYVETGERIGDVGNTGQSTGPHLHFTVYKNGVTVNPRVLMR
jgi:murein DD-endopeptidase MepM/ murein hydrolase activator NlpD